MKNFIQEGDALTLAAPYARTSGQGALVGSIFGVATSDVASGANGVFMIEGVVSIDKVSAQAWTVGQKIYWDDAAKLATSVLTSNTYIGAATQAASNPSSFGTVRLTGPVA